MSGLVPPEKLPSERLTSLGLDFEACRNVLWYHVAKAIHEVLRQHMPMAECPASRDFVRMFPAQQHQLDTTGQRVQPVLRRLRIELSELRVAELAVLRLAH